MADTFAKVLRQLWIDAALSEDGELSRSDICAALCVSVPQASYDLREYMRANPGRIAYDRSAKVYRTVEGSCALFGSKAHAAAFEVSRHVRAALEARHDR